MNNLSLEDLRFLNELGEKRREQTRDGCADPVFWMIQDEKNVYCEDGEYLEFYVDGEVYYDTYREFDEEYFEEFKKYCLDYYLAEDTEEFKKIEDNDDLYNYIEWYSLDNVTIARFNREHFITDMTGPFLTKESAEEHLKDNYYHYSKNARVYGMTAWRNPEFQRLMEIIEKLSSYGSDEINADEFEEWLSSKIAGMKEMGRAWSTDIFCDSDLEHSTGVLIAESILAKYRECRGGKDE